MSKQSRRIAINGRFLTRPTTGVDRFAREIVTELDKLIKPDEAEIVVSEQSTVLDPLPLKNIQVVKHGAHNGHAWEQMDLASYIKDHDMLGLHLCMTGPLSRPDIVCVHDMAIRANPSFFNWKFVLWYRMLFSVFAKRATKIITVSDFSKREMENYYPYSKGNIEVIPNAWQHMNRVAPDPAILEKHPELQRHKYYFAMSALAPNKNLKWLVETARLNPDAVIAIAGGINTKVFGEHDVPQADNVLYLGYVSDEESKALLENCKGFLYPTFYEGFGIPPMEALSCNAPIAVSNTEIMHEIYGDAAFYVDPFTPHNDLDGLFNKKAQKDKKTVLDKYNWASSAEKLLEIIEKAR